MDAQPFEAAASETAISERGVARLRSPATIRERCSNVLEAGVRGELAHFEVRLERLEEAVAATWQVTREQYPELAVPLHSRINHFGAGGIDRVARLAAAVPDARERARSLTELVVTSVLLDAGAGSGWRFVEPETNLVVTRSEGLAVASFHCFARGAFSSDPAQPWRADAAGLEALTPERLGEAFLAGPDNPLVGLDGRAALLVQLGRAVKAAPEHFAGAGRVGGLCDALASKAVDGTLDAAVLLESVLSALAPIWPDRTMRFGVSLGDVWPHPAAGGEGATKGLVPLHKLSQWLSYSLIYPLGAAGIRVVNVDGLTGLAEYRNGGLFYDTGVLASKHPNVETDVHLPSSEVVVEWRALTVALLDRLATSLRERHAVPHLSLGQILEGGTWTAGRRLAAKRRNGAPPIRVHSDGTLF